MAPVNHSPDSRQKQKDNYSTACSVTDNLSIPAGLATAFKEAELVKNMYMFWMAVGRKLLRHYT